MLYPVLWEHRRDKIGPAHQNEHKYNDEASNRIFMNIDFRQKDKNGEPVADRTDNH